MPSHFGNDSTSKSHFQEKSTSFFGSSGKSNFGGSTTKKKKKSGGGFFANLGKSIQGVEGAVGGKLLQTAGGFGDMATGLPTGLYHTGKVIAFGSPSEQLAYAKALAKAQANDFLHPIGTFQHHPANLVLDALAAASLGSGAAARGASLASKADLATQISRPTRLVEIPKGIPYKSAPKLVSRKTRVELTDAERQAAAKEANSAAQAAKIRNKKYKYTYTQKEVRKQVSPAMRKLNPLEVAANVNPIARMMRKATLDPLYKASLKRANEGRRGGGYARKQAERTIAQRERIGSMLTMNTQEQLKELGSQAGSSVAKKLFRAPGTALRWSVLLRPRYLTQNLPQAGAMAALAGVGPKTVADVVRVSRTRPDLFEIAKAATGEGFPASLAEGSPSQRLTTWAAWMNAPEARIRTTVLAKEAEKHGYKNFERFLEAAKRNPYNAKVQRVVISQLEKGIDYGRLAPWEQTMMRTQLPVFYPMYKGFTRYAGRFPTQNAKSAAVLGTLATRGNQEQRKFFGGAPPWWAPGLIGMRKKGRSIETLNPENISLFSPGYDAGMSTAALLRQGGPIGGNDFFQFIGPAGNIAFGGIGGGELATGFPYKQSEKYKKGGNLRAALAHELPTIIPGGELAGLIPGLHFLRPSAKTFKNPSRMTAFEKWLFGPAFTPQWSQPGVLQKQIRQQNAEMRKRKRLSRRYG